MAIVSSREASVRHDASPLLLALVALLVGIPSALVVKPLGAAGTPAGMLADLLLVSWGFARIGPAWRRRDRTNPVSMLLLIFITAMLIAYVAGMVRPITHVEINSADRGLLVVAGWAGIVLVFADGIRTKESLDRLLRVLVMAGAALATLGIAQFFFGLDIASYLRIPGLVANQSYGGIGERADFRRVAGTAMHPIEFGAVLTLLLPIALHYAMHAPAERRKRQWLYAGLIIFGVPLTVARSAMLGLFVGLGLLFVSWNGRQRRRALMLTPPAVVLFKIATPHLLGTIKSIFIHASDDPSIQNRLGDYAAVGYYFDKSPVFGRGFFTWVPAIYRTLDNQYLGLLIEAGIVGLASLLILIVGAALVGLDVRSRIADRETRSLAYSLFTSMIVGLVTFFTFDAFAFPMCMGVFFLLIGAIGCLYRLAPEPRPLLNHRDTALTVPVYRWMWVARSGAALLVLVVFVIATPRIAHLKPRYQATSSLALYAGATAGTNIYSHSAYLSDFPSLLQMSVTGPDTRAELARKGIADYEVAIGSGSLAHDTDVLGKGDVLTVATFDADPAEAIVENRRVVQLITQRLAQWQKPSHVGLYGTVRIQRQFGSSRADPTYPSSHRAIVISGLLCIISGRLLDRLVVGTLKRRRIVANSGATPINESVTGATV